MIFENANFPQNKLLHYDRAGNKLFGFLSICKSGEMQSLISSLNPRLCDCRAFPSQKTWGVHYRSLKRTKFSSTWSSLGIHILPGQKAKRQQKNKKEWMDGWIIGKNEVHKETKYTSKTHFNFCKITKGIMPLYAMLNNL